MKYYGLTPEDTHVRITKQGPFASMDFMVQVGDTTLMVNLVIMRMKMELMPATDAVNVF